MLPLSTEARALLIQFANKIEGAQCPNGELAHITGFASKAAEQAARIAGVLAVFDDPEARELPLRAMQCGVKLSAWYVAEAQRLMDAGPVDETLAQAQLLLDWLKPRLSGQPFDKRMIVSPGPAKIRDSKTVERLLVVLVQYRHIRPLPLGTVVGGHVTSHSWELCAYE